MNVRAAVQAMVAEANRPGDHCVFVDSSHGNGDGKGNSYLCLLPDPRLGRNADEKLGQYWDRHLAEDLSREGTNQACTLVFLDACYSGGMLMELCNALPNCFGTSTCSQSPRRSCRLSPPVFQKKCKTKGCACAAKGKRRHRQGRLASKATATTKASVRVPPRYVWGSGALGANHHGAWTNCFLVQGLEAHQGEGGSLDMVALFQNSYETYVRSHGSRGDRPCCFLSHNGQRYNTNDVDEPSGLPRGLLTLGELLGAP